MEVNQRVTSLTYQIRVWVPVLVLVVVLDLRGLQVVGCLDLRSPSEGKPTSSVSVEEKIRRENTFT